MNSPKRKFFQNSIYNSIKKNKIKIHLAMDVKDCYTEDYKTWLKEMKADTSK